MAEKVIYQAPGFTIALSSVAVAAAPYAAAGNAGAFLDLRDRPDLIEEIAEAKNSPGLQGVLGVLNARGSPLMTIACDKGLFPCEGAAAGEPACYVGCSLDIVFRDFRRNQDPDQAALLAKAIVANATADPEQRFCFELIVEPLRHFFDLQGCYTLNLKLQGYGESEADAESAFERAARQAQRALKNLTRASFHAYRKS